MWLFSKTNNPHLGASSDGIVSCTCHDFQTWILYKCHFSKTNLVTTSIFKYEKKFGNFPYEETLLLSKLIIAQIITVISSSKSICVIGTMFCSMRNFFTCPINLSTWILTFDNSLEVSTSFQDNWFFLFVKCGTFNSSLKVKPLSAKIQSPIEILSKKPESTLICLSETLPPQPADKNITVPDDVIPIKCFDVLLCL